MCRVLAYLGQSIPAENLLYKSDSALLNQVFKPKMLSMLNLAGFGMVAWDKSSQNPTSPWRYHTTDLPIFDNNLRALCQKMPCSNLLAHIRGVPTDGTATISEQNLHPFIFPDTRLAMAHNGDLYNFGRMRYALVSYIHKDILPHIQGNTDSEWIYALLLSCFDDPGELHTTEQITLAVQMLLSILRKVRKAHAIDISSSLNLFISNSDSIVAMRYAFDYGCYPLPEEDDVHQGCVDYLSLWFTQGRDYAYHDEEWKMVGGSENPKSIIVSSEPLSKDTSTWIEIPEYHLFAVNKIAGGIKTRLVSLE